VAAVFIDFRSWDPILHRAAPYEELFAWGTRPMEVGAYDLDA